MLPGPPGVRRGQARPDRGEQYKRVPFRAAAAGLPNDKNLDLPMPDEPGVEEMAARCQADPRITVHLNARHAKSPAPRGAWPRTSPWRPAEQSPGTIHRSAVRTIGRPGYGEMAL